MQQQEGGGYESSSEDFPTGVTRNTVGNIPLHWYDDYEHIGYDLEGKKILKTARRDQIEEFLAKTDNPNYWRTLYDSVNDREVVLTDAQLEILQRIQRGEVAEPEFDQYENLVTYDNEDWFHPLSNKLKPKKSFQPSKWESARVAYLVRAIKNGWIELDKPKVEEPSVFQMWQEDEIYPDNAEKSARDRLHIPAPKMKLPGHAESYRPPDEYLFTDEEKKMWEEQDVDERALDFIPQKKDALRHVGAYPESVRDSFHRCLDLYMCPRQMKSRMNVDPDKLLPKLPKPRDLKPYPTGLSLQYEGHTDLIRSIDLSPDGQFMVSGSDDRTCRVWDVQTGRCLVTWTFDAVVQRVAWNPNPTINLIAVAVEKGFYLMSAATLSTPAQLERTQALFVEPEKRGSGWKVYMPDHESYEKGYRVYSRSPQSVDSLSWHRKGDYFVTHSIKGKMCLVHRLTTRKSQPPFKSIKEEIQDVKFHATRPYLVIATRLHVRIFDLTTQSLRKKIRSNTQWLSCLAVHPTGDHVLSGSHDRRVCWYDLDRGELPYKVLRYHTEGVRSVVFHRSLPLFASCAHDGSIQIFHGRVFDDLMRDPLIVPLKILRTPIHEELGVMDVVFHKSLPWIFAAGADGIIRLFTDTT